MERKVKTEKNQEENLSLYLIIFHFYSFYSLFSGFSFLLAQSYADSKVVFKHFQCSENAVLPV